MNKLEPFGQNLLDQQVLSVNLQPGLLLCLENPRPNQTTGLRDQHGPSKAAFGHFLFYGELFWRHKRAHFVVGPRLGDPILFSGCGILVNISDQYVLLSMFV